MSFVRPLSTVAFAILLGATACSGAPHDLDLEDLQGTDLGAGAGPGTGTGTGAGTSTGNGGSTGDGGGMVGGTTFSGDVGPAVNAAGCTAGGCHDAAATSGQYSLTSYDGALGAGSDQITPNVIPGDSNSRLLTKCGEGHEGCAMTGLFTDWIVDSNAAP